MVAKTGIICFLIVFLLFIFVVDIGSFWKCTQDIHVYKYINKRLDCKKLNLFIKKLKEKIKSSTKFVKEISRSLLPNIVCKRGRVKIIRPNWLAEDPWYKKIYNNIKCLYLEPVIECFYPKPKTKTYYELTKETLKMWKEKVSGFVNRIQTTLQNGINYLKLILGCEIEIDLDKCQDNMTRFFIECCHLKHVCTDGKIRVTMHLTDKYHFYLKLCKFLFAFTVLVILHILMMAPEDIKPKDDESIYYTCTSSEYNEGELF